MSLVDTAIEKMQSLPLERQQEIIDFIDFLISRGPWLEPYNGQPSDLQSAQTLPPQETVSHPNQQVQSFAPTQKAISVFEAAGDLIGCVEGPSDLSTNKRYMEGYGT
jgi:hypothetical protein